MAATYDPAHGNALSRVRFALGDFDLEHGTLLTDEAILAALEARGEAGAIAWLAQGLATMYSYEPDKVSIAGGPTVEWSRVETLRSLATGGGSDAGGTHTSRRPLRELTTDPHEGEYTTPRGVGWEWSTSPGGRE